MDLQFYGANCFSLSYKGTKVVIDDNLAELGGKSVLRADDVALFTAAEHPKTSVDLKLMADRPGEYEIGDVSIQGIAARAHMDEAGTKATMYKVTAGDVQVLFTGHIHPDLTAAQLEAVNQVDVLVVPVGGMGYTLDAIGALKLIKEFEPKLVIPAHYAEKGIGYPVPQANLDIALKELAMEPKERVSKLKIKSGDFGEGTQLIILEKS